MEVHSLPLSFPPTFLHSQEPEMWLPCSFLARTFASPCLGHKPKARVAIVKVSIWFSSIESQESPWNACMQVVCHIYHWKALDKSYNFALDLTSIEGLHKMYGSPKCKMSQFQVFWDSQLGSPKTKWHLDVAPIANHREYYKGEGGGFPQVRAMMSFVSLCMPVVYLCTKNVPTM